MDVKGFKMSPELAAKMRAFGTGLTAAQKDEFAELVGEHSAEIFVWAQRQHEEHIREAFGMIGKNLATLLR